MKSLSASFAVKNQSLSLRLVLPPCTADAPPEARVFLDAATSIMFTFCDEDEIIEALEMRVKRMKDWRKDKRERA